MITRNNKEKGKQIQIVSIDQLVPEDHLLRKIDENIDFDFIYDLVKDKYSEETGRPSIDPVTLIKLPMIQYLYGIRSMRQTVKEIEVNVAYRWFLGLDFFDAVPHFSTFGKNYKRRFEGTDLFEQIFSAILKQCMDKGYVETGILFVDSTHVKARANRNKYVKTEVAKKAARRYEKQLREEIDADREAHGKKPLDDRDDDDGDGTSGETKEIRQSTTDPESGWFHKGEHKEVFAYSVQTACDINGWIMGYSVNPGNNNDIQTFPEFYDELKKFEPEILVADRGYKTPAPVKMMVDDGVIPVLPYTRPKTKDGFFFKNEYVYDEYYDCYICPEDRILKYSTTNRDGYREYKSDPNICAGCPSLGRCTKSKSHQKVVTRHVWQDYIEFCEDIRHDLYYRDIYKLRKETIERVFGTAKEMHGMRYAQMVGKAKMSMKVGLTFACMNMKKLAKLLSKKKKGGGDPSPKSTFSLNFTNFFLILFKTRPAMVWKAKIPL